MPSCSLKSPSLVEDESNYKEVSRDEKVLISQSLKERKRFEHGSSIHAVTIKGNIGSRSFEQATIVYGDLLRVSFYAPNFSKLLYYTVVGESSSLSCDVNKREALVSYVPDQIYLPELPEMLLSSKNFKDALYARIPDEVFNTDGVVSILLHSKIPSAYILKVRLKNGWYEGLIKLDREGDNLNPKIEKAILRPDNSDDVVMIDYQFQDSNSVIPVEVNASIVDRSLSLKFKLSSYSHKISGDLDQVFSTTPPPSYKLFVVN